jgi:tyrosinase
MSMSDHQVSVADLSQGNFLSWHRYYIWAYEQALRNECGYKGYLPYNNWSKWAKDPLASPLFDGSKTSISGDGEYVAGRGSWCIPSEMRCMVTLHSANGGGCIKSGPFKEYVHRIKSKATVS